MRLQLLLNQFWKLIRLSAIRVARLIGVAAALGLTVHQADAQSPLSALMPKVEDHTSIWWKDGFPNRVAGAEWIRCIRTGHYAMVVNTETLEISHLGPVPTGVGYDQSNRSDVDWSKLPSAKLKLTINANGKSYRCVKGAKWTRFSGPRLIVSGRFLQRTDITDLEFAASDGERLKTEARVEIVAWPDRLAFVLSARPGADSDPWRDASMEISLGAPGGTLRQFWPTPASQSWNLRQWRATSLTLDPVAFEPVDSKPEITVQASEIPNGDNRPVNFDATLDCHRVNLDGIEPMVPAGQSKPSNDAIERVKLVLSNSTDHEQIARLIFEKTARGFRQRIGAPITGVSAILRDKEGNPTGIPVQLSKNWHNDSKGGVYAGQWFHGVSQLRLPASSTNELELALVYGHWGGLPAASHAQLSLIGWGGNQLWEQSALGSWGESICHDPNQAQANASITDVRPLMVTSMGRKEKWGWTINAGGGDFLRLFNPAGKRVPHEAMRSAYHRQGPCLTEVTHAGRLGPGVKQSMTVSLARSDDVVRGVYRIRLDANQPVEFSRFAIFQIGADSYSYTSERKIAVGFEKGLIKEWDAQWGGDVYRTKPAEWTGRVPWVSLHEAVRPSGKPEGAWANRGLVLREWKARLGGKPAAPWFAERGVKIHARTSSTFDVLPPPDVKRLEPGDFIEATIEHIVMPQFAADYYGPNEALRAALAKHANTWQMIYREAVGNDRRVEIQTGSLTRLHPDIRIRAANAAAQLKLTGGIGQVPITFTDLQSNSGHRLIVDGRPFDQSVHGSDFWQTDYDPRTRRWSLTYNIPASDSVVDIRLESVPMNN